MVRAMVPLPEFSDDKLMEPDKRRRGGTTREVEQGAVRMTKFMKRFLDDESGATAIEYGLIAAGIAVAIIAAVNLLGDNLTATFDEVSDELVEGGGET